MGACRIYQSLQASFLTVVMTLWYTGSLRYLSAMHPRTIIPCTYQLLSCERNVRLFGFIPSVVQRCIIPNVYARKRSVKCFQCDGLAGLPLVQRD